MDSEKGQQEMLLSGEVKRGTTSSFGGSSTFKTALQVVSMILLVVILCTLAAGVAFVAGTRSNSPEDNGNIVVLVGLNAFNYIHYLGLFVCSTLVL